MIHSWGAAGRSPGAWPFDRVEREDIELREEYRAYRERQARRLVGMLPREAIRPLYRAARAEPALETTPDDPLSLLAAYCERILPLPPFEVWAADRRRSPEAHLMELADAPDAPSRAAPATLEARRMLRRGGGSGWIARLRGFRDRDAWRGFIAFENTYSGEVQRTALIFREDDPGELRRRFLDFETGTLEAFLRSTLP